jgi:hypothetical protein
VKSKKLTIQVLLAGLILGWLVGPGLAATQAQQKAPEQKKEPPAKLIIPKEVKEAIEKGLPNREARTDIPFTIFKRTYLPAQGGAYCLILFFKVKNGDLGYGPAPLQPAEVAAGAAAQGKLRAATDVFFEFYRLENGAPPQLVRDVFVPINVEVDAAGFDANKDDWYSVWYPLMPGNYLLGMAITSRDFKKIGTQYFEISMPDPKAVTKELEITPPFFVKELKNMPAVEQRPEVHKGYFTYSILQIVPNIDEVFTAGDALDVFFYIVGAQPNEQSQFDIEIQYEVKKGEETVIKYEPYPYKAPLISHPLPMKQTVLIKEGDQERREQRDLPPGSYSLQIKITDKISGLGCTKLVNFTVK